MLLYYEYFDKLLVREFWLRSRVSLVVGLGDNLLMDFLNKRQHNVNFRRPRR